MVQLKNYVYNENEPLSKPHNDKGIFNACYRGKNTDNNQPVVVSEFRDERHERFMSKFKRIEKLKNIKHPNLAQIYDVILDKSKKSLFVILEWSEGGDLYSYLKSQNFLDFKFGIKVIKQLAEGIKTLHELNEIHRNINMENIDFTSTGDFKFTFKWLYPKNIYLSPQEKTGTKSKENDIFSLGVLAFKLLTQSTPFKAKSQSQSIQQVKQGLKFPKNEKQKFPITIPAFLKQLLASMVSFSPADRPHCEEIISILSKYKETPLSLSRSLQNKIFNESYLPIFIRQSNHNESIVIAADPNKKEMRKVHIIKAKPKDIKQYLTNCLEKFKNVQEVIGIIPILDSFVVNEEYLVISSFYDNQVSLSFYLENEGSISPKNSQDFIRELTEKMQAFGRSHNHLTTESIILRKGQFYVNYPPIMTQEYVAKMKENKGKMNMVAPEILNGQQSQNADGWSVAAMKYLLENDQLPKLDANGNPNIPREISASPEDRQFYKNYLVVNPEKRKSLNETDEQFQCRRNKEEASDKAKDDAAKKGQELLNLQKMQSDEVRRLQQKDRQRKLYEERKKEEEAKLQGQLQKQKEEEERRKKAKKDQEQKDRAIAEKARHDAIKDNKEKKIKSFGEKLSKKCQIFLPLEKHWTKPIRVSIKCILGLIMLIFLFYWKFFLINGQLITEHSIYEQKIVHIKVFEQDAEPSLDYNLVTKTPIQTYDFFYGQPLSVLRDEYHCLLNDYSVESDVVDIINRSSFTAYQIFGVLIAIINLILFCLALSKMDYPKIYFISKFEENDFTVLWNWMFINMAIATQISFTYLLYGSLFHMRLDTCLEKATLTAVEFLLKDWVFSFNIRFIWIYIGLTFSYCVLIFFVAKPQFICNKVIKGALVLLYFAGVFCRIMGGSGDHVAWEKESVFGKLGELLLLIIGVSFLIIDLIFGCKVEEDEEEKKSGNKVNEESRAEIFDTQMMLND